MEAEKAGCAEILIIDTHGVIHEVSAQAAAILGQSSQNLVGTSLLSWMEPVEPDSWDIFFLQEQDHNQEKDRIIQGRIRTDSRIIRMTITTVTDENPPGYRLLITIIPDSQEPDQNNCGNNSEILSIITLLPESALILTLSGTIEACNQHTADLFRTHQASLLHSSLINRTAHHNRKKITDILKTIEEKGSPVSFDLDLLTFDNRVVSTKIRVSIIHENNDRKILMLISDITKDRQMEDEIRHLASIPRLNPFPVIEFSLDRQILYANQATLDTLKEIGLKPDPGLLLPDDIGTILQDVSENLSRPALYRREVQIEGKTFAQTLHYIPDLVCFRLYADDITSQVKTRKELEQAVQKLNLLSSITRHDIKNNLQVLRGYLGLVMGRTGNETYENYLSLVDDAAKSINQQIDFSRDYQLVGVHAPVWQDIPWIITEAAGRFDLKSLDLVKNVEPVEVYADPMLVKLFYNLIDNSLRHGGGVTEIRITSVRRGDDLVITYADNGKGIPTKKRGNLFSPGRTTGGGHGLFLVKEILGITGMTIEETGTGESGARFEILIPDGTYRPSEKALLSGSSSDQTGCQS